MSKAEKILQQVKDGYNRIAGHFSATRYAPWAEFELFKEYIKAGQKILDLGCGNARFYKFLQDQGIKVDYYGLDNSEELIKICKEKYPEVAENFVVGEMADLPYQDNYFDLVIGIASFHHLPSKTLRLQALAEIRRVLKPGGYLLMSNWHLWHQPYFKHFFKQFFKKISLKDFFVPWKSADGRVQCQRYYHAFTKGELKKLLRQADFKTEAVFLKTDSHHQVYGRGVNIVSVASK